MEEMVAPRKEREIVSATPYGEPTERGLEELGASVTCGRVCCVTTVVEMLQDPQG